MTASLGRLLILASLLIATSGAIISFAAARTRSATALAWSRRLAYGYAAFIALANAVMVYALVVHDFSVSYVSQVGSRSVPLWVTIVSLWSSLEGSILFWGLVLGVMVAVAQRNVEKNSPQLIPNATAVWLACGAFFSFLLAGPAHPFATIANPPLDGPGPNPLLQNHILMAVHPPLLYLGYVGMTIPFGLASAALLNGTLSASSIRTLRRWILLPWTCLTVAMVVGGWWAYEVLGWGGYWAWDPVENATLIPWLTATAALHSAILMERKGVLKGWTMTLVLATFLLTILGTFMTRSGVFNSVHSFTQSAIGPTILAFFALSLAWSVAILTMRIDKLSADHPLGNLASRDVMFLVNNLLFVLFTLTVLIGTVFPLFVEAIAGRQISVGRPYFDKMAIPLGLAILFLMGVGPALPWGRIARPELWRRLLRPTIGAAILLLVGLVAGARNVFTLFTMAFGGYAAYVTLEQFSRAGRSLRQWAAYVIHAAVIVVIIAMAVDSTMRISHEIHFTRGQSVSLGSFMLTFLGANEVEESHRSAIVAEVEVRRDGKFIGTLTPRMNFYATQREPVGTPAVRSSLSSDLYLSIVSVDPANQTLAINAMINPMVPWIWIATGVLAIAGLLLVFGERTTLPLPRWRMANAAAKTAALMILLSTPMLGQSAPDPIQIIGKPDGAVLTGTLLDQKTAEVASVVRCPVCQGLSVNDSPSSMAVNMKQQVRDLLSRGYSREQILKYFETSYGEFVLLEPPKRGLNWLVWVLPALLLVAGLWFVFRITRNPVQVVETVSVQHEDLLPDDEVLARYVLLVRERAYGWKKGVRP